jgi:hypothetical protein
MTSRFLVCIHNATPAYAGLLGFFSLQSSAGRTVHPRDLERGLWPKILRLTERLLQGGFEPSTPARLLEG